MFKSYSSNEVEVMAEALHRIAAVLERIEGQLENQPKEKTVYTNVPYAQPTYSAGSQSGLGPK